MNFAPFMRYKLVVGVVCGLAFLGHRVLAAIPDGEADWNICFQAIAVNEAADRSHEDQAIWAKVPDYVVEARKRGYSPEIYLSVIRREIQWDIPVYEHVFAALLAAIDEDELFFWNNVKDTVVPSALASFLRAHPSGHFAARARKLHAALSDRAASINPPRITAPSRAKAAVGTYPAFRPGETFKDCADCPVMVVIPPGKFFMGDISGKGKKWERPVHEVSIDYALAVGKFEITRKQFAQFVRATGKSFTDGCIYFTGDKFELDHSRSWADPGYIQTDDDPAVCVSWDDAQVYLRWLNKLSTGGYRLLSEAEWEYAARAGSLSKYSFGDDIGAQCDHMNGADKSTDLKWRNKYCDDGYGRRTAPVGRYEANAFGLHDFHGNASEWVQDCEKRDYYDALETVRPIPAATAPDVPFAVVPR